MAEDRPNPEKLLEALEKEERKGGALKIYFGYAAGVGKSYAMLKGAHDLKKKGVDVVVGYLEPHGRSETEDLLYGLEATPFKQVEYQGVNLREFDLEAVLKRRPQVVLVDEMAHTNANGLRHSKRWQDIDELLKAGIDVHTTLNVQHLVSLNDIVSQITGVDVKETIPDAIFDQAIDITLIDISPEDLLKRLKEGKVYRTAQAERALGNYFKKENLIALREIALRRTAQHVHDDVTTARSVANIQNIWPTQEKLVLLVDSDEATADAIRTTARLARNMQSPWFALSVTTPKQIASLPAAQERLQRNISLAEELGGKVIHREASFRVAEAVSFAHEQNATKIIFARPRLYSLEKWLERIILFFMAHNLDVIWVRPILKDSSKEKLEDLLPQLPHGDTPRKKTNWRSYIETTGYVLISFLVAAMLGLLNAPEANLTVIYLLAVIVAAVIHGQGASAWAAFLSAVILSLDLSNFSLRFSWANAQYLLNFGLSLGIGLLASNLTSRLRNQARLARQEREVAESLYDFTAKLSGTSGLHQIVTTAQEHLGKIFERPVVIFLPEGTSGFRPILKGWGDLYRNPNEWAVADWVGQRGQMAGASTQTLPNAKALYLPLKGTEGILGVMAISRPQKDNFSHRQQQTFEKYSHPLAVKLEAATLAENAQKLYWQAERERLRGNLLSSVSNGLKAPLAKLIRCANALEKSDTAPTERQQLLGTINHEAMRLERVVDNLTHLTYFEAGKLSINRTVTNINEFVKEQLENFQTTAGSDRITFQALPADLIVNIDNAMVGQIIYNLVDNALQHTGEYAPVRVRLENPSPKRLQIIVEDEGPGISDEQLEKIFEKYYRLVTHNRGVGLGLTVCRAVAEAHGGSIWAQNGDPKGLKVTVELPIISG